MSPLTFWTSLRPCEPILSVPTVLIALQTQHKFNAKIKSFHRNLVKSPLRLQQSHKSYQLIAHQTECHGGVIIHHTSESPLNLCSQFIKELLGQPLFTRILVCLPFTDLLYLCQTFQKCTESIVSRHFCHAKPTKEPGADRRAQQGPQATDPNVRHHISALHELSCYPFLPNLSH